MATRPNRDSTHVWRKSRRSGASSGCVEVALTNTSVRVRDSRDRLGTSLTFSSAHWRRFVRRIKNDEMQLG
jgi:Domain of unknown function (DUF397)